MSNSNSTPSTSELSVPELMTKLGTSTNGLRQTEAKNRLTQYGYNELAGTKVSPLIINLKIYFFQGRYAQRRK